MTLEPGSLIALFLTMLVLASIPGASVVTVCARTLSFGFAHGALATLGIVCGDVVFIAIALLGLALLMEALDGYFLLIQALGALFLAWLALGLWRSKPIQSETRENGTSGYLASYLSGLFITLPDQKALLFYLGFFPAFVDIASLTSADGVLLVCLAAVAVAVPKLVYAGLAQSMRLRLEHSSVLPWIYRLASVLLLLVALMLVGAVANQLI